MTVASNKKNGGFFISLSTDVGGFYDAGEEKKRKYGSVVSDKALEGSLKTYSLKEEADSATMSAEGNFDIFHFLHILGPRSGKFSKKMKKKLKNLKI